MLVQSDPEQAAKYMDKAKSLAPNDANVAAVEAEIKFVQGDIQKALDLADSVCAQYNDDHKIPGLHLAAHARGDVLLSLSLSLCALSYRLPA